MLSLAAAAVALDDGRADGYLAQLGGFDERDQEQVRQAASGAPVSGTGAPAGVLLVVGALVQAVRAFRDVEPRICCQNFPVFLDSAGQRSTCRRLTSTALRPAIATTTAP